MCAEVDRTGVWIPGSLKPQTNAEVAAPVKHAAGQIHDEAAPGDVQGDESSTTKAARKTSRDNPSSDVRHASIRASPRMSSMNASSKHHDLPSFLEYASRVGLKTTTNVYKGTHYEYVVAQTLTRYHFSLNRVGRANDRGIDLIGSWTFPGEAHEYRVIIQCKATQCTPSTVRELEGSFTGAPAGWDGNQAMALLATAKPLTPGMAQALQRSRVPMAIAQVTVDGSLQQFVWNQAAEHARLSGLTVSQTYSQAWKGSDSTSKADYTLNTSISLMWMGKRWTD